MVTRDPWAEEFRIVATRRSALLTSAASPHPGQPPLKPISRTVSVAEASSGMQRVVIQAPPGER